jgi:hypothetical protein
VIRPLKTFRENARIRRSRNRNHGALSINCASHQSMSRLLPKHSRSTMANRHKRQSLIPREMPSLKRCLHAYAPYHAADYYALVSKVTFCYSSTGSTTGITQLHLPSKPDEQPRRLYSRQHLDRVSRCALWLHVSVSTWQCFAFVGHSSGFKPWNFG